MIISAADMTGRSATGTEEDSERDGYTFSDDINDSDGIYDYNNGDGYDY